MSTLKDLARPPFANYDVVVYFGGGLFSIPFANRYLMKPLSLRWPSFNIDIESDIATQVVSGLCLAFSIYIFGHLLAYAGSQFIEKIIDRMFGKISTSIIISAYSKPSQRNELIRASIYDRIKTISEHKAIFPTTVRLIPHVIAFPIYAAVYFIGIFGYYNTRIPRTLLGAVRKKLANLDPVKVNLSIRTQWFKILEYCVISRSPAATARMYNYLVISGLFRTLCVIFLFSLWAQFYFIIHYAFDGEWLLSSALGRDGVSIGVVELLFTAVAYTFCLFSYMKFQRRYAEEAIFAFIFDPAV